MQGNELRKKKEKFQLKKRQRFRKNHRRGHRTRARASINITPQTYGTEEVCIIALEPVSTLSDNSITDHLQYISCPLPPKPGFGV